MKWNVAYVEVLAAPQQPPPLDAPLISTLTLRILKF
jgi:hypothetical protein